MALVLFAYNRPEHFEKTLKSALKEFGSKNIYWYIYIDGPKTVSSNTDSRRIASISNLLLVGEKVKIISRPTNIGLKSSIILGVTEVFTHHEQAVILEDDLTLREGAYEYFRRCFDIYKDNKKIIQISGFSYNNSSNVSAYFLPITTSWGWATWRDRWDAFINDTLGGNINELAKNICNHEFDLGNAYHFSKILKLEIKGKVSSWAILFYLHAFQKGLLTLYPPHSLVINGGFDGSGTHGSLGLTDFFTSDNNVNMTDIVLPANISVIVHEQNLKNVQFSLKSISLINRLKRLLKFKGGG